MKTDITCSIPGGWHGNDPDSDGDQGNVVINPAYTFQAITWLEKRATITGTWITTQTTEAPGLVINYKLKR